MRYFEDHPILALQALDSLSSAIALVDEDGVVGDVNEQMTCLSGYTVADLLGENIRRFVPDLPESSPMFCRNGSATSNGATHPWSEKDPTLVRGDGTKLPITLTGSRLTLDGRHWTLAVIEDDSASANARQALRDAQSRFAAAELAASTSIAESEQRFRLAFEGNMAPMVFSSREGIFLEVNDSYCQMTGRTREELVGRDSKHFTYPEDIGITEDVNRRINAGETDQVRYSKRFLHKNGRIVIAEVSICSARDVAGNAAYFISSVRDVTEERALASQLSYQALHDPLTGLANRALFDDHILQARERIARQGGFGAVLLLDLDEFKGVNDTYGHLIGDQLLVTIAHRFEKITRSMDTICRFGGDEFLYLADGLKEASEALLIGRRLLEALAEPFVFDDVVIEQRASVGIVVWDASDDEVDGIELVQNADASMYEAKRRGHGQLVIFTPEIRQDAVSRFRLDQELRHALAAGEMQMHFQPIMDLQTSDVVGFEALMRWQHPERGWIPPDVFIPLAEQSEIILELGAFAMHEAITTACAWEPQGARSVAPYVSVNLSAHQFHDPDLVPMIERELEQSGLDPERLILEVTESVALLDIAETLNVMEHLNRLKIGVALDDFGTGYSSLSYLAALNPRIIKIDQSFIRPKHDLERSNTLLEAIVTLGNKLDMFVLAEGIETTAQLEHLHSLKCDHGQGFLWSPAVPSSEVLTMLEGPA